MSKNLTAKIEAASLKIATDLLNLDSLDTTRTGADFKEQAVWSIREALRQAFLAGYTEGAKSTK